MKKIYQLKAFTTVEAQLNGKRFLHSLSTSIAGVESAKLYVRVRRLRRGQLTEPIDKQLCFDYVGVVDWVSWQNVFDKTLGLVQKKGKK